MPGGAFFDLAEESRLAVGVEQGHRAGDPLKESDGGLLNLQNQQCLVLRRYWVGDLKSL